MKFFKEITKWADNTPNHTYLLSDDKSKMYAYVPTGKKSVVTFKKPIRISASGRKFQVAENKWHYRIPEEEQSLNPKWQVQGSKGDIYVVEKTETGLTCTCSGFKFRANCKHIKDLINKIAQD